MLFLQNIFGGCSIQFGKIVSAKHAVGNRVKVFLVYTEIVFVSVKFGLYNVKSQYQNNLCKKSN